MAVFFAIIGFMRGWNREVIGSAGILLGMFALFQFDPLVRGTLLLSFPRQQAFIIQAALFLIIVFFSYRNTYFVPETRRAEVNLQDGILGAVVGFVNGYLVGGTLWYFMDINEYPLSPLILAPAPGSPSERFISSMPLVLLSGGVNGSGEFLLVAVVILFLIALVVL
ncbi:MAG: hypothetical protein OHK0046_33060 [Anaerolineae bacterium]